MIHVAPGQSGDDPVLQPGDYSYPFQFLIPNQNMPTSVEASHGYVRYWLKGIIDRPWRFDISTTAVFTMLEYVDINTLHLLVSLVLWKFKCRVLMCQRSLEAYAVAGKLLHAKLTLN